MTILDPEKRREYYRKWSAVHRERETERARRYRAANREKYDARNKAYYQENADKIRTYSREYARANPATKAAQRRSRVATQLQAMPSWAEEAAVKHFYQLAAAWNLLWPEDPVHVDHVVPLKGRRVCGLHVENNLRIIRAVDNQRKHARFEPE